MRIVDRIIRVPYVWETLRKAGLLGGYQRKEYERLQRAKEEIDARLARKRQTGEKVNVLFICHRPSIWASLKNVYEALKADPLFQVQIVAVPLRSPVKGRGYLNSVYTSEGAEDFFREEGGIPGYHYETKEWLDLRTLKPDYVFFQQPYNVARPDAYTSSAVSDYAKICYITYYVMLDIDHRTEDCTPVDFMHDLSFYFSQNAADAAFIRGRLEKGGPNFCRVEITGHPRLEGLEKHQKDKCSLWSETDSFKIMWTPRWTTSEGNCHFFSYRDPLTAWCRTHKNTELLLRPHPQAFKEWHSTGEMNTEQESQLRQEFSQGVFHLDEAENFYPQLFTADVLITDPSSIIIDAYFTGKPIIYFASNGMNDSVTEVLRPGMYWVNSWEEAEKTLDMLHEGHDPLKGIREECAQKYQATDGMAPTEKIQSILRADALGCQVFQ